MKRKAKLPPPHKLASSKKIELKQQTEINPKRQQDKNKDPQARVPIFPIKLLGLY